MLETAVGLPPLTRETSQEKPLIPLSTLCGIVRSVAESLAGFPFYSYQKELSESIIESLLMHAGTMTTVLQARQSGKTTTYTSTLLACALILPVLAEVLKDDWRLNYVDERGRYWGFLRGLKIGVYGPSSDIADIPGNKVREMLNSPTGTALMMEMSLRAVGLSSGPLLRLSNGSSFSFRTADAKAKKEGFTYDVLVLDEAQDMETMVVRKSLHPFVAASNGCIFKIGTASSHLCDFYEAIQENKHKQIIPGQRRLHFEFDWRRCAAENMQYAKFIDLEKSRIGEASDEFAMSYGCRWLFERGMFIPEEVLLGANCAKREGPFSSVWPFDCRETGSCLSLVAGIDFAKSKNSTVLTLLAVDWTNPCIDTRVAGANGVFRYRAFYKHVVAWKEWYGDNFEQQFHEILEFFRDFTARSKGQNTVDVVCVDATGLGVPIYERLCSMLPFQLVPFVFSASSKSDGYKMLSSDIYSGRLTFPFSEEARETRECRAFVQQMTSLRKEWDSGRMKVFHENVRGAHDDYPDSLMMANWAANEPPAKVQIDDMNLFRMTA